MSFSFYGAAPPPLAVPTGDTPSDSYNQNSFQSTQTGPNQNIQTIQPNIQPKTQPKIQPISQPMRQPISQPISKPKVQPKSQPNNYNRNKYPFKFKKDNPDVRERKKECDKILRQFPGKIPIICEKDPNSSISDIDKNKYLVPGDLTVSQFNMMIRKRVNIPNTEAFYLLVNAKNSITGDILLSEIYDRYKDPEDGFLYIAYASELTWGNN